MAQKVFLVEPKPLTISRFANNIITYEKKNNRAAPSRNDLDNGHTNQLVRSAGDGMEFEESNDVSSLRNTAKSWPEARPLVPLATSTPAVNKGKKMKHSVASRNAKELVGKMKKSENISVVEQRNSDKAEKSDLVKEIEKLKLKIKGMEEAKEKFIEEKMKISTQLGIQTQVNSELKTLLVASVGEDLEERLEAMSMKNALTQRQVKHLQSQLDEKHDELESAVIQSDVWRSKFLASKVMADELASWKALTDSKYRESNAALETLLEEHRQLTTTIASSNRFLLKLSTLTNCYSEKDDLPGLPSLDLAIINHRLAKRITERAMNYGTNTAEKAPVHDFSSNQIRGKDKDKVFVQEKLSLSLGEKRALRAIEDANSENSHVEKRKKDFLAHNRISQILATKYPMTCLVCRGCKGTLKTV